MAKVISISKSLGPFSMPDIMLRAWHGLSDSFTPHNMPQGNCYYPHLTDGRNWGKEQIRNMLSDTQLLKL